ncbi:MAG: PspC family transcriptional regulator [Marinoscillum sp.]|nr:PspC family transcriptional regulator [Marinoscillum sp.]OUX27176.1 MAG: PspC family transcriptional regulator [Flammeovirgaceae bacterium TMED262]|tara:strand:+ start:2866 stop:3048 length:183 start_codon:yes stop_codon:yes gene_type:complete
MKRVFRDSFNGILGGVCSGLGEYFKIDPVIFRLLFIAFFFMFGGGIFIYLIAWLIIPDRY